VVTGEAAVTIGAQGEGMVAGDIVNTASRVQSAADPGTVLVGEGTRRVSEQAVVYEPAGDFDLKGKAEPVALWRALRVVSGVGGSLKSAGLEPPFVGRDRELKLIKDLFWGSATDKKAHLVSVTGIAGIGKSRLVWEFYKYFDGIVDQVWWHRGRCLAYGEGVAYWALADMVRMRCRIGEDEDPAAAREKLTATVEQHVPDGEERAFIEPRLAQLLGLDDGSGGDRQDLFAAWRLFFERLSDTSPVVMVFEDMQWADSSLLDFVEYLLEWSRDHQLYVVTLARPELHDRRPGWGAGQRNFSALYLEPLAAGAMEQLLDGLVPGLPEGLRAQILARAEGVPLYAVETVRMLLDRGVVAQEGTVYRPTGEIPTLEVPETLQALIAARLDGLSPDERRLLQDAAVLGKTFSPAAVAALAGSSEAELEPLLSSLVRKEVLTIQVDPRSPERGQYGFLQDLVRHVAYETVSKRERKARHLAAAEHLEHAFAQEEEVAEVLASHYLAAYEADPEAEDAEAIRAKSVEMLTRAGERAGSLGAPEEGRRYYEQAAGLVVTAAEQAELLEHAGRLARLANRQADARDLLGRARSLRSEDGDERSVARTDLELALVDLLAGDLDGGASRLEPAVAELERSGDRAELARGLELLGRIYVLNGRVDDAAPAVERALTLAERLGLNDVFLQSLISRSIVVGFQGRREEERILLQAALERAEADQLTALAARALNNLAAGLEAADRVAESVELAQRSADLARRRGDRAQERTVRTGSIIQMFHLRKWDEALAIAAEEGANATELARVGRLSAALVYSERGQAAEARALLEELARQRESGGSQGRAVFAAIEGRVLRAEGRLAEALASAERALGWRGELSFNELPVKAGFVEAVEAAFALGDVAKAGDLVGTSEALDPGERTPYLQAHTARLRARLIAANGSADGIDERFRAAAAVFREFGFVFYVAQTQLEHGEWLIGVARGEEAEPLLADARKAFERVGAAPWLERVEAALAALGAAAVAG
jgi:hypothetical protein